MLTSFCLFCKLPLEHIFSRHSVLCAAAAGQKETQKFIFFFYKKNLQQQNLQAAGSAFDNFIVFKSFHFSFYVCT